MMEAARDFVEALKTQPALLVLSVSNFVLLAFIFYALHAAGLFRQQMLELLAKCATT